MYVPDTGLAENQVLYQSQETCEYKEHSVLPLRNKNPGYGGTKAHADVIGTDS